VTIAAVPPRVRMTGPQRRAQLLQVGLAVFAERGPDGTSVEEVAARAGVSKPVVYEHFSGKDGLYAAVVDAEVQHLLGSFAGALTGESPRLLLEQATLALLTYVQDRADGFRILVRESPVAGGSGSFATIISNVAERVEHVLAQVFASRALPTALAGLYSQALVGQVALVGQWWLDHPQQDRDVVAAHLVNLAWNGLAADPAAGLNNNAIRAAVRTKHRRAPCSPTSPPGSTGCVSDGCDARTASCTFTPVSLVAWHPPCG